MVWILFFFLTFSIVWKYTIIMDIKIYSTSNTSPHNFHTMDFLNSMVWILSESMDSPDIFHSMEMYNYCGKSKSILFSISNHSIPSRGFSQFFYICVSSLVNDCYKFLVQFTSDTVQGNRCLSHCHSYLEAYIFLKRIKQQIIWLEK